MTMGYALARHLLARTGFGGRPQEIEAFAGLTLKAGVDRLLAGLQTTAALKSPSFVDDPPPAPARGLSRSERKARRKRLRAQGLELQAWWFEAMVKTPSPLTERLTLMWHNHFTSSLRKARWPTLMWRQNQTLRRHGAGDFQDLLAAMLVDPAMLLYLDNQRNRAGNPNENLARELLELFALGAGNYQETDIKEVARALTGLRVNPRSGVAQLRRRAHDWGAKSIFGQTGAFGMQDLPKLLVTHGALPTHIVRRVYREFVGGQPDAATLSVLAKVFRDSRLNIQTLLRAVFTSDAFKDPKGFGTMIRSPAELLVSTLRVLELPVMDWTAVAQASRRLGQALMEPPNVKGWPGGASWVNAPTLLARQAVVRRALRGMDAQRWTWDDVARWLSRPGAGPQVAREPASVAKVLLPVAPLRMIPAVSQPMELFDHLLLDPTYQLT